MKFSLLYVKDASYSKVIGALLMAAAEVTEEAILNLMSQAETTIGRNQHLVHAYSFDKH